MSRPYDAFEKTLEDATSPVIDVHAHLVPRPLLEQLHSGDLSFPHVQVVAHEDTFRVSFAGGPQTRPVAAGLMDPARRTAWLDDNGIDLQLVGGWLDIFGYELDAQEGADWAEVLTAGIREAADSRQVPLGTVPLQSPERAADALRSQRSSGLPGVMVATRAGEVELSDPSLSPFWEAADETGAVVYLHPGFGGASERYHDFGLVNGLARLEDTTVTLARLLYAGVPARFPGARIVVAHAGAALPYVMGRLTRNHLMHPEETRDPVESFSHLYFDSVVFDAEALEFLVTKVGADRVLLGSDYPFPIGDLTPRDVVAAAKLSDAERAALERDNVHRLLTGAQA